MFSLVKGVWNSLFQKPNFKVLLLGLDGAGKTGVLNSIKKSLFQRHTAWEHITPTVGLNIATVEMDSSVNTLWDLGGQKALRKLWGKYIQEAHAIVYCIDATLADFSESLEFLVKTIEEQKESPRPMLLFLTKLDLVQGQEQKEGIVQRIRDGLQGSKQVERLQNMAIEFCSGKESTNLISPLLRLNERVVARQ